MFGFLKQDIWALSSFFVIIVEAGAFRVREKGDSVYNTLNDTPRLRSQLKLLLAALNGK